MVTETLDVADVIEDHRLLARLGPQAAADHLEMQRQALGGPQQQAAPHRRHIDPLTNQVAAGEHLQLTAAELLKQPPPLQGVHRAIDRGRGHAPFREGFRHGLRVGDRAAEGDGRASAQVAEVVTDGIAKDAAAAQLTGGLPQVEIPHPPA